MIPLYRKKWFYFSTRLSGSCGEIQRASWSLVRWKHTSVPPPTIFIFDPVRHLFSPEVSISRILIHGLLTGRSLKKLDVFFSFSLSLSLSLTHTHALSIISLTFHSNIKKTSLVIKLVIRASSVCKPLIFALHFSYSILSDSYPVRQVRSSKYFRAKGEKNGEGWCTNFELKFLSILLKIGADI